MLHSSLVLAPCLLDLTRTRARASRQKGRHLPRRADRRVAKANRSPPLRPCGDNGGHRGDSGADHPRHHPPATWRLPQARHQDRLLGLPPPVLLRLPARDHLRRLGHRQVAATPRIGSNGPGGIRNIVLDYARRACMMNSWPCARALAAAKILASIVLLVRNSMRMHANDSFCVDRRRGAYMLEESSTAVLGVALFVFGLAQN